MGVKVKCYGRSVLTDSATPGTRKAIGINSSPRRAANGEDCTLGLKPFRVEEAKCLNLPPPTPSCASHPCTRGLSQNSLWPPASPRFRTISSGGTHLRAGRRSPGWNPISSSEGSSYPNPFLDDFPLIRRVLAVSGYSQLAAWGEDSWPVSRTAVIRHQRFRSSPPLLSSSRHPFVSIPVDYSGIH